MAKSLHHNLETASKAAGFESLTQKMSRPPTPWVIWLEDNWSPLCHVSPHSCTLSPMRIMCMCNMPIFMRAFETAGVFWRGRGGSTCLVSVHSSNSTKKLLCEQHGCWTKINRAPSWLCFVSHVICLLPWKSRPAGSCIIAILLNTQWNWEWSKILDVVQRQKQVRFSFESLYFRG